MGARRQSSRPLCKAAHYRQGDYRLLRADRLLNQPADRRTQLSGSVLERGLLRQTILRKPLRRVHLPRRFKTRLERTLMAAETLHEVVQQRAYKDGANFPRRDNGAARKGRRRDRQGVGRLHGGDVLGGSLVLHIHERQCRLAQLLLPSAQRDSGQRLQLYARCGRPPTDGWCP